MIHHDQTDSDHFVFFKQKPSISKLIIRSVSL